MVEQPSRQKTDLAEMVEMLLDKGVVVNADIVVSIGDTELLGVKVRAAIASFETAAEYGLEFPEGTDMDRVEAAAKGERREGLSEAKAPVTVTESSKEELDAAEARRDDKDDEDDELAEEFLTNRTPVTSQTPASGQTRTSAETPATGETPASPDAEREDADDDGPDEGDADESAPAEPEADEGDADESESAESGDADPDDTESADGDDNSDADADADESADEDTSPEDQGDEDEA